MGDLLRELGSYPGLAGKLLKFKASLQPKRVAFGPGKDQYFLHYAPAERRHGPVVFYLHGGGWNSGSPSLFPFIGEAFAREGWHCVLLGYRKTPKCKWPGQMEDVCEGYRLGLQYLAAHNIEVPGSIVAGSSAGAQLGAMLCYGREFQEKYGLDTGKLLGFAGLGGPYLFPGDAPFPLRKLSAGLFAPGQDREEAQPYHRLEAGQDTPMLIIHSLRDAVVGYGCGEAFYRRARGLGIPASFYIVSPHRDSHSAYTAGCFLEGREDNRTLDTLLSWMEERAGELLPKKIV